MTATAPANGVVPATVQAEAPRHDWTVLSAVVFTVLVVGGAYAVGFATAFGVLSLRYGLGTVLNNNVLDPASPFWSSAIAALRFSAATLLSVELLQLGLALIFAGTAWRTRIAALQLTWPRLRVGHWIVLLLILLAVKAVATLVSVGLFPSSLVDDLRPFEVFVREPLTSTLFLATVMLAGLTEELVFRGVLSRTLEETRLGFWGGALLANLAFAIVHTQYGLGGQFVVLAIGMTLSWMRASTGSIWPGAICHALNNAMAFLAMQSLTA